MQDHEIGMLKSQSLLNDIFPIQNLVLSPSEQALVTQQRLAGIIMDAAGPAAMRCNQMCPFRNECSLYLMNPPRHPVGQICPFEIDYLRERFLEWMDEMGRDLDTLCASERLTIGNLCSLQLELQRIRKVLSRAENAEMNQLSVRDVNAESGEAICWENTIHTAAQRENEVLTHIRMIMKDFELTPEAKTKKAKALGIRDSNNIATKQSGLYEKIRKLNRPVIEVQPALEEEEPDIFS